MLASARSDRAPVLAPVRDGLRPDLVSLARLPLCHASAEKSFGEVDLAVPAPGWSCQKQLGGHEDLTQGGLGGVGQEVAEGVQEYGTPLLQKVSGDVEHGLPLSQVPPHDDGRCYQV